MKRILRKKLLSAIAAIALVTSISCTSVFAASYVSGSIGGIPVSGSLSMGSTSATATTSISSTSGVVVVSLDYKYGFGTSTYIVSASNGNGASSVTVSASSSHYGSVSIGAKAKHSVYYGSTYTWKDDTSVGESF